MGRPGRASRRCFALYVVELLLAASFTLNLASCSVLLPVTAVQSNRRYPKGNLEVSRVTKLPGHPRIRIVTVHGDTLQAIFSGIRMLPPERYGPRYAEWRAAGNEHQPDLNERVTVIPKKGKRSTGSFLGFGAKSVWLHHTRMDDREYPLESLKAIRRASGIETAVDSLAALGQRNQLPSRLGARLRYPSRVPPEAARYEEPRAWLALVPVDDVQAVFLDSGVANPPAAFLGGVALDALVLLGAAAAAFSDSGCSYDPSGITFGTPY